MTRLHRALEPVLPKVHIEAHSNITAFARRLRQPIAGPAAVIAAAYTRQELEEIPGTQEHFNRFNG